MHASSIKLYACRCQEAACMQVYSIMLYMCVDATRAQKQHAFLCAQVHSV